MTDVLPKLGHALTRLRQLHGFTQKDLAEKLEIGRPYMSEIESGEKIPSLHILKMYLPALGLPLSFIFLFTELRTEDAHDPILFAKLMTLYDQLRSPKT